MDSQWTAHLPRVGARDIEREHSCRRPARSSLNSLSSANRITAPFSVLTSDTTKASRAHLCCLYSNQPAKTYFFSVDAVVPATAFFANAVEAEDAA